MPVSAQPAPHAAHDARAGGLFATAAGDTLHIEASWSEQRRVRLFVTDGSGSPIPLDRMRAFEARAIAGGVESPFTLLEADYYFEARIPTLAAPAVIVVRLTPAPAAAEDRLTFTFPGHSPAVVPDSLAPVEIPGTLPGILVALGEERRTVQSLIDHQRFAELLGAENRIRELVLAIEPYLGRLAADARLDAEVAITSVVRACWLLHTVLDYGSVPQRDAALKRLSDGLDQTIAAVSGISR